MDGVWIREVAAVEGWVFDCNTVRNNGIDGKLRGEG